MLEAGTARRPTPASVFASCDCELRALERARKQCCEAIIACRGAPSQQAARVAGRAISAAPCHERHRCARSKADGRPCLTPCPPITCATTTSTCTCTCSSATITSAAVFETLASYFAVPTWCAIVARVWIWDDGGRVPHYESTNALAPTAHRGIGTAPSAAAAWYLGNAKQHGTECRT